MEECLTYFRLAVTNPASALPWAEWWAANEEVVQHVFPLVEYVRLKHRRLRGAREILLRAGHLPSDFRPPHPRQSGVCSDCGESVRQDITEPVGTQAACPKCGLVFGQDE